MYALAEMTTEEIHALLVRTEGKVCWRSYARADGTVLTKDCPEGLKRIRQRTHAAIATAAALLVGTFAGLLRDGGFWNTSQRLGSWAAATKQAAVIPAPLKAAPEQKKKVLMGGVSNEY